MKVQRKDLTHVRTLAQDLINSTVNFGPPVKLG
jgi:hypothetical protein